jgi:hypothetical protein
MQMQVEEFREKRSHEISGCDFNLAKTSARREISHAGLMLAITL